MFSFLGRDKSRPEQRERSRDPAILLPVKASSRTASISGTNNAVASEGYDLFEKPLWFGWGPPNPALVQEREMKSHIALLILGDDCNL